MRTNPLPRRVDAVTGILSGSGKQDDRLPAPVASQVVGEIGLLIAAHLAVAFAIVLTLQTMGIGD